MRRVIYASIYLIAELSSLDKFGGLNDAGVDDANSVSDALLVVDILSERNEVINPEDEVMVTSISANAIAAT